MKIEHAAVGVVVVLVVARAYLWVREWSRRLPVPPDPWDSSITEHLDDPDCLPVCHRCLTPQTHHGWHCPQCGTVVGPYGNYLPYVYLFSLGEVFRNGVQHHLTQSPLVKMGYLALSACEYTLFAPVYWFFLFRNLKRCKKLDEEPPLSA